MYPLREAVQNAVVSVLHDHGPTNDGPNTPDPADCPRGYVHLAVAERVAEAEVIGALIEVVEGVWTDLEYDDDTDLLAALDRLDALTNDA